MKILKGSIVKCGYCGKEFYTTRNIYCSNNCSCLARRKILPKKDVNTKGNSYNEKLYKKWWHMISRCTNEKDISYKNYGLKGVKVCDEWLEYKNFKEWSLSNNYNDSLEIDRIDVNGNYEPNNCRYVTKVQNVRNRRNTLKFLYDGKYMSLGEIAEIKNIDYKLLWQKIHRDNKTLNEIVRN